MKLHKLYNLISRNVILNLVDPKHKEVYYYGSVRNIPNTFDNWLVHDIKEISSYEYFIEVTEK